MSLADLWNRTLIYFGIAEENEDFYDDENGHVAEESLEQSYRDRPNVRRLTPRRRSHEYATAGVIPGGIEGVKRAAAGLQPRLRPARRGLTSRRCRTRTQCGFTSCFHAGSTTRSRSRIVSSSRHR